MISKKGSILHYAAITNSLSTLRLIVEIFKIDINSQIRNEKQINHNKINPLNLPDKSTLFIVPASSHALIHLNICFL